MQLARTLKKQGSSVDFVDSQVWPVRGDPEGRLVYCNDKKSSL